MGVGRGGVEAVLGPSLLLKFDIFLLRYMFSKKGCLLSFEWKKWNFTIFAHPTKILGFTWKILLLPPLVHNVWLIMDNCWTTVLWSGSTKLCNRLRKHFRWFALKYFFALDIKSLIDLKIFGATFWIGGGQLPSLALPPGYAPGPNVSVAAIHCWRSPPWACEMGKQWSSVATGDLIILT